MFDFQIDFVTHFDFHQTYMNKIERQLEKKFKPVKVYFKDIDMMDVLS